MIESVIVGLLALIGTIFTAVWQNKKLSSDFEKQSALADMEMDKKISVYAAATDAKIETLSAEVHEHNAFAKRVPLLELKMENAQKDIEALKAK